MPFSSLYSTDSASVYGYRLWTTGMEKDSVVGFQQSAAAPEQVWGGNSDVYYSVCGSDRGSEAVYREEPWQTSVIMVVIICFYCFILYRFRTTIHVFVKSLGHTGQTLKLMQEQGSEFGYFMRCGVVLAVLAIAAVGMEWLEGRTAVMNYYLFAGVLLACLVVILYRKLVFFVIQGLSGEKEAFRQIRFLNRTDTAFIALLYAPFAVVISQSGRGFAVGMVLLAAMWLYHFLSLYKYFRMREFSKFQYILYLCTVEMLPVSFVIALAIRNSGIN